MGNLSSLDRNSQYFKILADIFNDKEVDLKKLPEPIGDSERKVLKIIEDVKKSVDQGGAYPRLYSSIAHIISIMSNTILEYPNSFKESEDYKTIVEDTSNKVSEDLASNITDIVTKEISFPVYYLSIEKNKNADINDIGIIIQNILKENKTGCEIVFDIEFSTNTSILFDGCSNITLTGSGKSEVTFKATNSNDFLFDLSNSHDIKIKGLNFISTSDSILVGNASGLAYNIFIESCNLTTAYSFFITHLGHDIRITKCNITDVYNSGISILNKPYNIYLTDNIILNGRGLGLKIYNDKNTESYNINIVNNTINNMLKNSEDWSIGIEINEHVHDCIVSNNIVDTCEDIGISISGVNNITCIGNIIKNVSNGYGCGLEIVDSENFVASSNYISITSTYALILDKSRNGIINANNINQTIIDNWDSETYDICIGGEEAASCNNLYISNNKLSGGTYGIMLNNYLDNIKINNNGFENIFYASIGNNSTDSKNRKNININENVFNNKNIEIGYISNLSIMNNSFNTNTREWGSAAITLLPGASTVCILGNTILNYYYVVLFSTSEEEHIKSKGITVANNIIDYSNVINNEDSLEESTFKNINNVTQEVTET